MEDMDTIIQILLVITMFEFKLNWSHVVSTYSGSPLDKFLNFTDKERGVQD